MTRQQVSAQVRRQLTRAMVLANLTGATVVYGFLSFLLVTPVDTVDGGRLQDVNTVVFLAYMALTLVVGQWRGSRRTAPLDRWSRSGAPSDDQVRRHALRLPLQLSQDNALAWLGAVVLFGAINSSFSAVLGFQVASTTLLGGVTTVALGYLMAERCARPLVTLANDGTGAVPPLLLGTTRRMVAAWVIGTGVPLVGLLSDYVRVPGEQPLSREGVLFLLCVALVLGLFATVAAARAVAEPVQEVAQALRAVGDGDLTVTLPVYDASEVGQLQAGFNAMAEGLRERERLRDLFGRQVGVDVARLALEQGVRLGGERREVAVLFVDVVGSTALAVEHDPEEVVRRLNAFFAVVVEAVAAHGGWVNKFEGDAALCVFGAPAVRPDAAADALAAARDLAAGLEHVEVTAAVGVGGGPVVAGHVGTERRFEYTVVGDPVNTAARLAELAKDVPGRVLADAALLEAAPRETGRWQPAGEQVLRGRAVPTRLVRLQAGPGAAADLVTPGRSR